MQNKGKHNKYVPFIILLVISIFLSCRTAESDGITLSGKYLPPADKVWFFMGQDLGAVGGLEEYTEGYVDFFGVPTGVTTYTDLATLNGLPNLANWGAGDVCGQYYVEDETFSEVMIAIGLYIVDDLENIIEGERNDNIRLLGEWIQNADRPVFLRIGYEFEGPWNHYNPELYQEAFRVIVDQLREMGVDNFVIVWQSSGYEEVVEHLMQWYPGDNYVDWLGYSYFSQKPEETGEGILHIARTKQKPVIIAEATPRGYDLLVQDGDMIWEKWFLPFFEHVYSNNDVVKAVAYINVRWKDQPMWKNQGWGDSRIQANDVIRRFWMDELEKGFWIHRSLNPEYKPFIFPDNYIELIMEAGTSDIDTENVWEAEEGLTSGNARKYPDPQASGDAGMAYIMLPGDSFWFEGVPASSSITIRYASIFLGQLGIYINNERVANFVFEPTGSWVGSYEKVTIELEIPEGAKLEFRFDEGDKAANIDYIKLD